MLRQVRIQDFHQIQNTLYNRKNHFDKLICLNLGKGKENMNKSKSMGYLKANHSMISPVYLLNTVSQVQEVPKIEEETNFIELPKMKLQNFGHNVFQSVEMQAKNKNEENNEFNVRMTLGIGKKNLSRQDYELMIDQQTKGMKKSDLMAVPNMKKSKIEENDSSFNTERSKRESEQEFLVGKKQCSQEKTLKKTGSDTRCQLPRLESKQSQIEINFDNSQAQALLYSRQFQQNLEKDPQLVDNIIINSIKSSSSFSISQFKAQFQNTDNKNLERPKHKLQLIDSFGDQKRENIVKSVERKESFHDKEKQKYELALDKVKKLELEIKQLTGQLTQQREKSQKLQLTLRQARNEILRLQEKSRFQESKIKEFQQKAEYESKINSINCEKLKKVSSQLSVERSRIRFSENSVTQTQFERLRMQLLKLSELNKRLTCQNEDFKIKLEQRDEIQLQNQIRIQELQELLERQKTKNTGCEIKENQSFNKISIPKQTVNKNAVFQKSQYFYQNKIKTLQKQNHQLSSSLKQKNKSVQQKVKNLQSQLFIIEKQSHHLCSELINKQKLVAQKTKEVELWKSKSYSLTFNSSAQHQLKLKALQQDLKLKSALVSSYKYEMQHLQKQIQSLTAQNQQLTECYNKIMRESYRFQGELKVIKEEQSLKQSFASSCQIFKISQNHGLTVREQNILTSFKEAIEIYNQKFVKSQKISIELFQDNTEIRRKLFYELQTATNVIKELLRNIKNFEHQIFKQKESKFKNENQFKLRLQFLQTKINQFEENQKTSPSSSNIVAFVGPKNELTQKFDQYPQKVTKKKSLLETISSETKLSRQVQKLKSIIFDKNKEISDLIASYEKLKLQKQTQSMLIKSKKIKFQEKQISEQDFEEQSDAYLVHDILDLQIRLNKQKEKKNLVMEQLELRKSLNRSQQLSQNIPHFDLSSVYQEIKAIITSRENYITTEETLKKLVQKINELNEQTKNRQKERSYKLSYLAEEKSRMLSKQFQIMKSSLLKLNFKGVESIQCKTLVANSFKPTQRMVSQLIAVIQQLVRECEE